MALTSYAIFYILWYNLSRPQAPALIPPTVLGSQKMKSTKSQFSLSATPGSVRAVASSETETVVQADPPVAAPKAAPEVIPHVKYDANNEPYYFFTEPNIDRILDNLDALRDMVFPSSGPLNEGEAPEQQHFPSVCLIGLGRCGSNIALDVASLVYNARQFYLGPTADDKALPADSDSSPRRWMRNNLLRAPSKSPKPLYLIEPLVMLGDLDKDIAGRIRFSRKGEVRGFLDDYNKLKIMDLSEVHAGGAGNAPILGQYLAKIILSKDTQRFSNTDWKFIHSYLIDSCGIKANQSRLYFYIFSAGGGTGSGMASEFGLAQQFSYMSKTFDIKKNEETERNQGHNFVFEPIFTCGICILPNISEQRSEMSDALHINAGRLLCKYLAEEWDFSYNFDDDADGKDNAMRRIRPWNAMMMISNDIMRHAEESGAGHMQNIDVTAMERYANQYISQQIFNILTAQAVTTDYDQNYFRRAGIDIGETIRLDANDLFMSLAGPVVVAYAESVVPDPVASALDKPRAPGMEASKLNIDDLFFRSIDLPHFNKSTQAIEGISLLPIGAKDYREALDRYQKTNYDPAALSDLHFFKNCSSVVSIVSLPKDYKLSYVDLNRLKTHLNSLFPNTTLKRYALVIGASANLSLTTLIVKSPCLSDEFLTLLVAYIKRCFARDPYRFDNSLDDAMINFIVSDRFDEARLDEMLNEHENPAKILDTNWYAIKPMYEKKYHELIQDPDKFVSINDIRLNRDSVKKAIQYLREIYRHRISKTRVISLHNLHKDSQA